MLFQNIRLALRSLRHNLGRTFLTMLGVMIGVSSVVTLVGSGVGVKENIAKEIYALGTDILVILPGKLETSQNFNPSNLFGSNVLKDADIEAIREVDGVESVADISIISGIISRGEKSSPNSMIVAAPSQAESVVDFEIEYGNFYSTDEDKNVAVIGTNTVADLFGSEDPIGKEININRDKFKVIGKIKRISGEKASIEFGPTWDDMVAIPNNTAKKLYGDVAISRIVAKVKPDYDINVVANNIKNKLLELHGTEDFSVLTQKDLLSFLDTVLALLTALITLIAGISLVVGGIGVMNIMLVTVAERTREIGLRKAVGAKNRSILWQFLTEAVIISLIGGAVGILISYLLSIIVSQYSSISPMVTWPAVILALGVSAGVGLIFGVVPAMRASRKNPIDALRYE